MDTRWQVGRRNERRHQIIIQSPRRIAAMVGMLFGISVANAAPLLDIVRGMPEGGWAQVNINKFSDVWAPAKDQISGYNPSAVINAWSGFAWDNRRGDIILYGGGHANHPGNEVYRWHGSNQMWERASLPTTVVPVPTVANLFVTIDGPDNSPSSAHTYKNNTYLELADRFLTFGGATYNTGGGYVKLRANGSWTETGPYLWDPNKADGSKLGGTSGSGADVSVPGGQMWQNRDTSVNGIGPYKPTVNTVGTAVYARENGKDVIYYSASASNSQMHLYRYTINDVANPTTDTWERRGLNYYGAFQDQGSAAYDPSRKIFVRTGSDTLPFGYWDLNLPNDSFDVVFQPTVLSGTYDFAQSRNCGMEFDTLRSAYIIWCGGAQVWSMKAPAGAISPAGWTIAPIPSAGSVAPGPIDTAGGVLGKWRYAKDLDAYVALKNKFDGEVWVYKPRAWVDPGSGNPPPPPPSNEIIVDNAPENIQDSAGGRTFTGSWCLSSGANPYGNDSLYSCGNGGETYRFTPNVAAAGSYDVYVRWTTHANRSTAVPITVVSSSGTVGKTYNEQTSGGVWILHGRYNFAAGKVGYIEVNSNNGQANADAVRLVPAASPPPPPPTAEIILDNASEGIQDAAGGRTFSGTWCTSSGTTPYGGSSIYSCGDNADSYRWTPTIATPGNYDVYVWWTTHANRSTSVPISVTHTAGTTTKNYNEQVGGGQWVLHGRYNFAAGQAGFVTTSDANGQSAADAVRFVPVQ